MSELENISKAANTRMVLAQIHYAAQPGDGQVPAHQEGQPPEHPPLAHFRLVGQQIPDPPRQLLLERHGPMVRTAAAPTERVQSDRPSANQARAVGQPSACSCAHRHRLQRRGGAARRGGAPDGDGGGAKPRRGREPPHNRAPTGARSPRQ